MADPISVFPTYTRNQAFPPSGGGGGGGAADIDVELVSVEQLVVVEAVEFAVTVEGTTLEVEIETPTA